MNDSELRSTVLATLLSIAPEVDAALLQGNRPLRLQVDLDSMDWLNFLIGLSQQLKIVIAESDYAELVSLNDLLAYLRARLPPQAAA
jgi:acyl carrier protein